MEFTWKASKYFNNSKFQYNHAMELILKIDISGNESILDVGCGDGKITHEISRKIPDGNILGLDSSPEMIKFAISKFCQTPSNMNFTVGSAENLQYKNEFDLILSFACLHWVFKQSSFLKGAFTSLKDKGKLVLNLYPQHPQLWNAINKTVSSKKWSAYFSDYKNPHINYSLLQYEKLLKHAGFKIIYLVEENPIANFPDENALKYFIESWLPHIEKVPVENADQLLHDISSQIIKDHGNISAAFRRLDVIATT